MPKFDIIPKQPHLSLYLQKRQNQDKNKRKDSLGFDAFVYFKQLSDCWVYCGRFI